MMLSINSIGSEPKELASISGTHINKRTYEEWLSNATEKDRVWPDFIKNKTNIVFKLDDRFVAAQEFYPFLKHVCEKAQRDEDVTRLALEMADWIEDDHVMRRISAELVLAILFPKEDPILPVSPVVADKQQQAKAAEKIRKLCKEIQE
jgi:hypothetical protein